jgi:hypothetical protein
MQDEWISGERAGDRRTQAGNGARPSIRDLPWLVEISWIASISGLSSMRVAAIAPLTASVLSSGPAWVPRERLFYIEDVNLTHMGEHE